MKRLLQLVLCFGVLIAGALYVNLVHAQEAPRRIEVTAKRFSFDPADITVKKGQPGVIVLKSADVAHGLRFRDLGLNVTVAKGGTAELNDKFHRPTPERRFPAGCEKEGQKQRERRTQTALRKTANGAEER